MTMKRNRIKYAVLAAVLTGAAAMAASAPLAGPLPSAHAGATCNPLLKELDLWLAAGHEHEVQFALASNRSTLVVSYATGYLTSVGTGQHNGGRSLIGRGRQYFSDRYSKSALLQPFSALATDQLGVAISVTNGGAVELTLKSWGGALVSIPSVTCANDVLYGFTNDNAHGLLTFSFSKVP
jgi:hypothetical protein